jgi:hypothetical protein
VTRIARATSASIGRILPATSPSDTARPRIYSRASEHAVHHTVAATRPPGTVSTAAPAGDRNRTPVSDGLVTCEFSALRLRLGKRFGWTNVAEPEPHYNSSGPCCDRFGGAPARGLSLAEGQDGRGGLRIRGQAEWQRSSR